MLNSNSDSDTGVVFELQRWSIHDGPGARTVVFLNGCPLRCLWCCNPESQSREPQIAFAPQQCIGCGRCTAACPTGAVSSGHPGSHSMCTRCGRCVEVCPGEARRWMGMRVSAEEVMRTVEKDMVFYRRSGGGVTFSGGEPLMQPVFLREMLDRCDGLGIDTAVETCGFFEWPVARDIIKRFHLVFFDIKHMDPAVHRQLTGVSNTVILHNAEQIARENIPLIVRIPVVSSLNDSVDNVKKTARFVRQHLGGAVGIELLPYHTLGKAKYERLGMVYKLGHLEPLPHERMDLLREVIEAAGVRSLPD